MNTAKYILSVVLALAAGCRNDTPSPIRSGKCVANRFEGSRITNQVCQYQGYNYVCMTGSNGIDGCLNVGEATGEKPQ